MKSRFLLLASLVVLLALGIVAESRADISNAAVLFLRIAPGSRAAGMGEAYVAIADDATATHWNPAGLGNAPLSDNWIEAKVPVSHQPLRGIAPLKSGGGSNYLAYDVWALGRNSLLRYDNRSWFDYEVFSTRTDETVEDKVRSYFRVTSEERLLEVVERVVEFNSQRTLEEVQQFRDSVMSLVPEDHPDHGRMIKDFDSLLAAYPLGKVNWDRYLEMEKNLRESLSDSVLSDEEITRISVATEKSRSRFIPEELKIPYDALFAEVPQYIASLDEVLLVGSSEGLARYNGRNWQWFTVDDGLPSQNVSCIQTVSNVVVIGTDAGAAEFNGLTVRPLTTEERALKAGPIEMIGGRALNDLYAVVNGDVYHFDGADWSNTFEYSVVLDDSLPVIANKLTLYKTAEDRAAFLEKYREIARSQPVPMEESAGIDGDAGMEMGVESEAAGDEEAAGEAAGEMADDTGEADAAAETDEMAAEETGTEPVQRGVPGLDFRLSAGDKIEVPYSGGVRGKVNTVYVDATNSLWLGTQYGLFRFNGREWTAPGLT
ncbi:hypothetical protein GF377_02910, partial [candidate division GN15 bacterium]|nr:hypothetical protein [candidate division GN15 bacterium]